MKDMKDKMSDSEAWGDQYIALDNLRIMMKFHSADLMEHLDFFAAFIRDSVNNLRSNISKNGIVLCAEIFKNKQTI